MIEAEANYGAGQLLFLLDRFSKEAKDLDYSWTSIRTLADRYRNTLTTTLWHFVEEKDPKTPAVGLISLHPRHPAMRGSIHDGKEWKYFICSAAFKHQFPHTGGDDIYGIVEGYATFSKGGPGVGKSTAVLHDASNQLWEFRFESFCNTHAPLLTFGVLVKKTPLIC